MNKREADATERAFHKSEDRWTLVAAVSISFAQEQVRLQ
jgi:hypothetical protein